MIKLSRQAALPAGLQKRTCGNPYPNYARAYFSRGLARSKLGDYQGAMEDYNQAIRLNPNYARAYFSRGLARTILGDTQQAIADIQKAAALFEQQGDREAYQQALESIKQLQQ